ncbi:MAG: Dihydrolipoamide acyltransferase component of branched-chain alpha-keto acid dehydrogenase complex [uncultured Nocardioidaceae bacterium]|uniref:Dihydrolipoamide acetyltransferase component of pyruvate dehydrogenase complex n=1 Tax=uncultured Nocardioidaceae bacterium TaxID=253824 RepID=A0A6J4M4Z3_9ACTN|nr:MAG: Dihydrolipoamide acyltransferase component of branched-chain alpha-keto acid dehydrogenase complex [uncultured Nocardioidaceae bacterium]
MAEYKLPDVGEGLTEAEIVTWKVKVGDTIKVNDIVVEIETAKSLVELPSPYAGTIEALLAEEGQTVAVGTPIISVSSGAASGAQADAAPGAVDAGASTSEPVGTSPDAAEEPEHKTLVGYGPRAAGTKRRPRRGSATPHSQAGEVAQEQLQGAFTPGLEPEQVEPVEEADEPAVPARSAPSGNGAPTAGAGSVLAKPPVRKLARDLGIDLATITPSGPNGTITRADVEAVSSAVSSERAEPTPVSEPSVRRPGERETREPIKGVRKMMAQAMVDSAFTAPHVTEWVSVDVTKTMRFVAKLRSHRDFREIRVSPLLVVAKAVALAARRTPEINATWDEATQEIVYKSYLNLGIAAATPRGLVVPNVKDADQMGLRDLGSAINALTATAREGRTQPAEMSGGTFTITNVGVFGVDAGTPIINPGESAILCFGAVRKQPWVHKGRIKPRDVTTLALSFDHRIVDGEKGSRFLADVAAILEDPASTLLY